MTSIGNNISELQESLSQLRERILEGDNKACFIEREKILRNVKAQAVEIPLGRRYAYVFEKLLGQVSTPIEAEDVFLGRAVEERWEECLANHNVNRQDLLPTKGHLTLDWPTLLGKGLSAVAEEARQTAERLGTDEARQFAENASDCCHAVIAFAGRYADAARLKAASVDAYQQSNQLRAAEALERVPGESAYDFFSALQSVWFIQFITSCYIGARDFGIGRLDRYLLPYYEQGIADSTLTRDDALELIAHFLMKTNEITGTATWNYDQKPVPCQSSKEYLLLSGRDVGGNERTNDLTETILEAAMLVKMPQPVLTVCMDPDSSQRLKTMVARVTPQLSGQIHFYNDRIVQDNLRQRGLPPAIAADYTMGGCCRLEIGGGSTFQESHRSLPHWLMCALNGGQPFGEGWLDENADKIAIPETDALKDMDDVFESFSRVCRAQLDGAASGALAWKRHSYGGQPFHFESLLLRDCATRGKDCYADGLRYNILGYYFDGISTVANILFALRRIVFDEKRFRLSELLEICRNNFEGHEALREEIVNRLAKFGNDIAEVDNLAKRAADIVLDAFEAMQVPPDHITVAGFYSLHNHHQIGRTLPATPDGRLAGEPISENQSPSYGTDRKGMTALPHSVARLPLERSCQGGLNVTFGGEMPPEIIRAVIDTYFQEGGLHVGFSFVDKKTLDDARANPEKYRSLTVRLYGFCEYFTALSPHEQQELINRTRY